MARHRRRHTRDRALNKRLRRALKGTEITRYGRRVHRIGHGAGCGRGDLEGRE